MAITSVLLESEKIRDVEFERFREWKQQIAMRGLHDSSPGFGFPRGIRIAYELHLCRASPSENAIAMRGLRDSSPKFGFPRGIRIAYELHLCRASPSENTVPVAVCNSARYSWVMTFENLADVAVTRLQGELAKDGRESPTAAKGAREKLNTLKDIIVRFHGKPKDKSALARFCVDLTARAVDGLIDPIIGRDTEVQRIIQILCRRTKNNPILLGEAGVRKTAIAEGLAINIAQGNIPVFL
ncbi:hypothetical protein RHMOL_Rhmol10G0144400 [Rhododendron molle]|uniref:Uncharacterized protein n=1 Tax=Rhododendron molle TaxID=49168 RepID=A0ACC0M3R3_RHOML|nr:hypothetical protein RHMOL_Rhmol10G0144400 [Rhododendron molle]